MGTVVTQRGNGTMKVCGATVALLAGILAILTYLGVMPWATRLALDEHRAMDAQTFSSEDRKLDQMNEKLDDVHADVIELLARQGLPHRHGAVSP